MLKIICKKSERRYFTAQVKKMIKELEKFFGYKFDSNAQLKVVYARAEMDKALKTKTLPWMVGCAHKGNILIFSPSVLEKVSPHHVKDLPYLLKHEISHIFSEKFPKQPKWISEGLAGYTAGQYDPDKRPKIKKLSEIHYKKGWNKYRLYQFAYFAVKYLVEKYGKKKLFYLMSETSIDMPFKKFDKTFRQVYGFSVNNFSKLLEKKLKRK